MPTYQHHTLDIYGVELYLATDRKQWRSLGRRLPYLDKAPESAGCASFAVFVPKDGGISVPHLVVWFDAKQHQTMLETIDTMAHEASHAAGQILNHIGHDTRGIDEPHAYLTGWLTRWIYEHAQWAAS